MSTISYSEAEAFLDDELSVGNIDFPLVCDGVEQFIRSYTRRIFDSASYTETLNGHGLPKLFLDNYPVTAIQRVAVGRRAALKVCNTNPTGTATVNVNSTGVVLTYNGTADSTCTFATYTTMTLLTAAIAAISGWAAELSDTNYGAYLSTELVTAFGKSCINAQYVDLDMPDEAEYDFEVDPDAGILEMSGGWPSGFRNVRVDYTAGYSETDMPVDLKIAAKILVKDWWEKRAESTFNVSSYAVGGMTKHLIGAVPPEALQILNAYKRYKV